MRLVFWWRQNGRRATRASRDPDRRERSSFQEVGATDAASSRLGSAPRNDPLSLCHGVPIPRRQQLAIRSVQADGRRGSAGGLRQPLVVDRLPSRRRTELVQAVGKRIGALNVERLHIRIVRWAQSRRQHRAPRGTTAGGASLRRAVQRAAVRIAGRCRVRPEQVFDVRRCALEMAVSSGSALWCRGSLSGQALRFCGDHFSRLGGRRLLCRRSAGSLAVGGLFVAGCPHVSRARVLLSLM